VSTAPFDLNWFRTHLLEDLLPHWLAAAPTPSGLFLPHLGRQWQRLPGSFGTLVSQGRLVYNFTAGYRLTGEARYAEAADRGARFLISTLRDPVHGGWFWSCDAAGAITDDAKDSYGHAFVVFGLAEAAAGLGEPAFGAAAQEAWDTLAGPLTDEYGGLIPRLPRDFTRRPSTDEYRTQNPMMHCFEALLALGEVPGHEYAHGDAARLADFVLQRRADAHSAGLPEMYRPDWTALPTAERGRIDIGHQLEWAYLLSAAVRMGLPERFLVPANEMLDDGLRLGDDRASGGIFADASLEGDVIRFDKGCWEQCEGIRAMVHHAMLRGREDVWEPAARCLAYVKSTLLDPEYGGWYADGSQHKGDHWKLDYHPTGMCEEIIHLSEAAP
jgi:cellobiose epimerase